MKTMKIYKLIYNNEVIYIGKTKQKYLSSCKSSGYPNIPSDISKKSIAELIEETDDIERYNYWIDYYKEFSNLYNIYKTDEGKKYNRKGKPSVEKLKKEIENLKLKIDNINNEISLKEQEITKIENDEIKIKAKNI